VLTRLVLELGDVKIFKKYVDEMGELAAAVDVAITDGRLDEDDRDSTMIVGQAYCAAPALGNDLVALIKRADPATAQGGAYGERSVGRILEKLRAAEAAAARAV
jgi:hypothetical protein